MIEGFHRVVENGMCVSHKFEFPDDELKAWLSINAWRTSYSGTLEMKRFQSGEWICVCRPGIIGVSFFRKKLEGRPLEVPPPKLYKEEYNSLEQYYQEDMKVLKSLEIPEMDFETWKKTKKFGDT